MFDIQSYIRTFRKTFTKVDLMLLFLLILGFFLTRLINIDQFPIFSDEGIYIRWAKVAWHDASWRFISLTDGRQPLHTWGMIPFLKLFPYNALLAGRLFSVLTGFVAFTGFFTLLYYLFGKKTAFIGTFMYLITPYFLFYDRLTLIDSAINAGFIWILFLSILLARTLRLDIALLMGLVAGTTLLAKSSARIFLGLSALAPILFYESKKNVFIKKLINFGFLFGVVLFLSLVLYNVQRLSPFFHYVAQKNNTFVMPLSEFKETPFKYLFHNLQTIPLYLFWEIGWLIVPFSFLGYWMLIKKNWRLGLYLLSWLILPYIALSVFTKVLFPRYIIFMAILLLLTGTYFISNIKNKKHFLVVVSLLLISQLALSYPIIFKPENISLPPIDRGQYVEGVTAVWGAKDLMEFAREQSKEKHVLLLAEGNFGLVADVLDVYLYSNDNISIRGLWPLGEKEILENQKETKDNKVYIVFSHQEEFPDHWPIKLVKKYTKPNSTKALYLFEYKNE